MLTFNDAHGQKGAVHVSLNNDVTYSRPPLTERLLLISFRHMVVLRESEMTTGKINEFRSAGAFSLAAYALNQRCRAVSTDTLSKVHLKADIAVLLTFDGAAELNDRVRDQTVVGLPRFTLAPVDFRQFQFERFVAL